MKNSRCIVLALVLTFISILYYGYYSYSIGDYMIYSLGAVNKLHPENFIKDSYIQTYDDYHPVFSALLYYSMLIFSEKVAPFIIFIFSKFLIFFGIILVAKRFIKDNTLYLFVLIFLFPFIYFGLANSSFGYNFPFPVPRTIGWGLFFIGFHFFLSKKYFVTSIFWGFAAFVHAQFIFLTFPLLILATIFFNPFKRLNYKNIYPIVAILLISLPQLILIQKNMPFQSTMSEKDYYFFFVEKLFYPNFNPKFFLTMRGDIFVFLCLPIFVYWKKIQAYGEAAKIWLMSMIFIFAGTLVCIFFTEVVFIKIIMLMWYPGFTPFITLSSIIFLIAVASDEWAMKKKNYFFIVLDVACIYMYIFSPYIGIIFFLAKNLFYHVSNFRMNKILWNGIALVIMFAAVPWGAGYQTHYYIKPWSGINFSMPEIVYYIKNYTKKDSLFLVPPVVWFMQPYAQRSTVADYSHPGLNNYAPEWKKRMDDIVGIDIFQKEKKDLNYLYAVRTLEDIIKLIEKYNANYYMTFNYENIKKKFENAKNFKLVHWDNEFLIYNITN